MRQELCFCADIPSWNLSTRVLILMHKSQALTPTNTGHLAALALTNSAVHHHGVCDAPWDLSELTSSERSPVLLYPGDDAVLLTPERE